MAKGLDLLKSVVDGIIIANGNYFVAFVADLALKLLQRHLLGENEDFLLLLAQERIVQLFDILVAVGLSEPIDVKLLPHVLS